MALKELRTQRIFDDVDVPIDWRAAHADIINRSLVTYAANQLCEGIANTGEATIIDMNDRDMPIYAIDRETKDGIPSPGSTSHC